MTIGRIFYVSPEFLSLRLPSESLSLFLVYVNTKMPDNKQKCKTCKNRHLPPTGKKCCYISTADTDTEEIPNGLRDAASSSVSLATDQADSGRQRIQEEILAQLKKMSSRLDMVEQQISSTAQDPAQASTSSSTSSSGPGKLSRNSDFLDHSKSTPSKKSRKSKKFVPMSETSESSSDDSDSPSLSFLKSQSMQKKVDKRIRELNGCSHSSGSECLGRYKSKRGQGNVDVSVKNKVLWPHEAILGGANRHRVTYDQLSLTQWVQGFCKNILEEKSNERKDAMVSYLSDSLF